MRVDRLLGEHGIGRDTAEGRFEFERRMKVRRFAEGDEEALKGLRRGWCFGSAVFRRRMLEEVEKLEGESIGGGLRQETAINKADRIVAEELKRLKWTEQDLMRRRKSDPGKLWIAARLRRETILSLKRITTRVGLGSSKSANAKLHAWMQANGKPDGVDALQLTEKQMPRKQPKLWPDPFALTPEIAATYPPAPVFSRTPIYHDLVFSNITASVQAGGRAGLIWGLPEMPVTNVLLQQVNITADRPFGIYFAQGVRLVDSKITTPDGVNRLSCTNAGVTITGPKGAMN